MQIDTSRELGVQWLINSIDGGGAIFSSRFPGTGGEDIEGVSEGILPEGLALILGRLDDPSVNFLVLIKALAGDSETNLLSTPSIVTLDNQEAEILVGQNVPFVTGETTLDGAGGVINPFRTIEREDIGISLKVKPQINEGNTITMSIEQEVSAVIGSATGAVDLVTTKRYLKTTVQLEDGELLILGGMIDEKVVNTEQKVPGLGDIPIIGVLFRSTQLSKVKQNLLIFIKATIIKDPVKARNLSHRKYNFMRDIQLEQVKEDLQYIPVLDPLE